MQSLQGNSCYAALCRIAVKFDASCSFFALLHEPTLRENPPEAATRNYASFAAISAQASFSFLRKELVILFAKD
jgi:hypothetical protein